jgi:Zn-dependent protease/CBS domain-containing protein
MFGRSFQVARIRGIAVEIHPSWLLILAFLAWTLSDQYFPDMYDSWSTAMYWVVGTISALALFVTVLIHELAHATVAQRRGLPVPRITLFIFGGVSHMSRQPRSAGEEFAIAAAGPATSLVIAFVSSIVAFAAHDRNEQLEGMFVYLAFVNLALAVFNTLPGFPLDGGRVLRSIAWKRTKSFRKATRVAASTGEMFGYLLMVGGAAFLLAGFVFNGIWFLFIGWFLVGAARAETQNLQLENILGRLHARDVMRPEWVSVVPGASIQSIVDDHMLGQGERAIIVANDGAVLGILSVSDVRRAPRETWAEVPVQRLMTPREQVVTVAADAPATDVLMLMAEKSLNQVPVLEDGRMIGMVSRRELLDRVQLVETLGPNSE